MKTIQFRSVFLLLSILMVGLLSCNLITALQSPTQDLLATSVNQTTEAILSQQGSGSAPTEIVLSSPTPSPEQPIETLPPVTTPIDVQFDLGSTSKTFQGMVSPDDMVEFRAYAFEGQTARVTLNSVSGQASLHIYGLTDLVNYVERKSRATTWEATLPESQNYLIKVLADETYTEFTLKIEFLNP